MVFFVPAGGVRGGIQFRVARRIPEPVDVVVLHEHLVGRQATEQRCATGPLSGRRPPGLILDLAEQLHGELVSATRSLVSPRTRRLASPPSINIRSARGTQFTAAVDEFRVFRHECG
jgi:hypothetical protein